MVQELKIIKTKYMKNTKSLLLTLGISLFGMLLFTSCGIDSVEESGIKYATKPAYKLPKDVQWQAVKTAKELINIKENLVILSDGENAITKEEWLSLIHI